MEVTLRPVITIVILLFFALTGQGNNIVLPAFNNGDCQLDLPLPDLTCQDFDVGVSGETGTLGSDLYLSEIRFIIEHSWDADLDVFLTSPAGQTVELSTDNGSAGDNYGINSAACDQYTALVSRAESGQCGTPSVEDGLAPFLGTFFPEGDFANFNTGSANGTWTLEICDDAEFSVGTLQYFEMIFAPYTCTVPYAVFAADLDSTSVELDWQNGNGCATTQLEYGPTGFTPGSGTLATVGCPPYVLNGLTPSTAYDFYLRESCADGSFSEASCVYSATTLCSPPPATLFENFENQNACSQTCGDACEIDGIWYNISGDDTDWLVRQGATPTQNTGPLTDADGNINGKYVYMETSCPGSFGWEAMLYSQCIEVIAEEDDCHFSFDYMMHGATVVEIRLQVTTDGQQWLNLWNVTGNAGQIWKHVNIDLSEYDGETAQFRFTTRKTNGALGDTALDNIAFHGSVLAGTPDFTFFRDNDGDGFGVADATVTSCFSVTPPGYATVAGDCNDFISFINPAAEEAPCDGFDANCNPADDNLLPAPPTQGATVCSGETEALQSASFYFGEINWYDTPTGGNILHTGNSYVPPVPTNATADTLFISYYAEEVNPFGCISDTRGEAILTVLPTPFTNQTYEARICRGDSLDLAAYPFIDENQTNFTTTYHTSLPPSANNQLVGTKVSPANNSVYFLAATTAGGCSAVIPLSLTVDDVPEPIIVGSPQMCSGTTQFLSVYDGSNNNDTPYTYLWTTGSDMSSAEISAPEPAGSSETHTVFLTGANGCTAFESLTVTSGSGLTSVAVQTSAVTTCTGSDGQISLTPTGGVAPYTYSWTGVSAGAQTSGASTFVLPNLAQGGYSFTVTDGSGGSTCATQIPLVVVNGPAAIAEVDSVNMVECYGENTGGVYLSVFGNAPTYAWSHGATTQDAENLTKGTYSVTISDNGCENILSNFAVTEPDSVIVKPITFNNASCAEINDGGFELTVIGGTPDFTLQWNNGDSGLSLDGLSVGTYTATLTDGNGCTYEDISYPISAPAPLLTEITQQEDVSCTGENDGTLSVAFNGGTAPFQVLWSNGDNAATQENLSPGSYAVTVTDLNGCTHISEDLEIAEPAPLTINPTGSDPNCAGAENGFLAAMTVGGNTPYTFAWSNGVTSAANFSLGEGIYSVTVTDAENCTVSDTFELTAPVAVFAEYETEAASCLGGTDGAIELDATSLVGNAPFTYEWSNGATTSELTNVLGGTYSVTVTDADNCRFADTLTIESEQPISLTANIDSPNCYGAETGQIALNAFGGMPFYTYQWSNGMTTETIENLPAGDYAVTVTAADDCFIIEENLTVTQPDSIEFLLLSLDSVVCAGTATGQVNLRVIGGAMPYNFTWNGNGSTSESLTNVPAGDYVLDVTDSNGCTVESPVFTVGEAAPLVVTDNIFVSDDINCETVIAADSLELQIAGGQQPYDILWNTGETAHTLYNIQPGDYIATVTDALGCTEIHTVKTEEDREALELFTVGQSSDCNNENTELCIEIQGGSAPFDFLWNDTQNGSTDSTKLCRAIEVGTYSLTVTDSYGCSQILENIQVVTLQPLNIYTDASDVQNVDCKGSANGAIQTEVTGGSPVYDYYWENENAEFIGDTPALTELPAGDYFLTVTDAGGCSVTDSWTLTEPATLITTDEIIIDNDCKGDAEGVIDLQVSGGVGGYTFLWTTGATTEVISGLTAGEYGVTITDANECVRVIADGALTVTEPAEALTLLSAETEDVGCAGANDGTILLQVFGGTPGYLFDWSLSTIGNTDFAENLAPGDYSCDIYDANACFLQTQIFTITEPEELTAEITSSSAETGTATIEVSGGSPFNGGGYIINWSNGDTGTFGVGLPQGMNSVTVRDANGCEISIDFLLGMTAVNEADFVRNLSVFPNPSEGLFNIDLELKERENLTLRVADVLGREIFVQRERNFMRGVLQIDLTAFAAGVYFVLSETESGEVTTVRVVRE